MGGVGSPMIIEGNPLANGSLGLRPRFPSAQVDAFTLEGPPEALDEGFCRKVSALSELANMVALSNGCAR